MNKKGFTLIELIMVIAILGILAAYAVPKFVDLADTAKENTMVQLQSEIKSGIRMYAIDQISQGNGKLYPASGGAGASDADTFLDLILDDYDNDKLTYAKNATVDLAGTFTYDDNGIAEGGTSYTLTYTCVGVAEGATYELQGTWQ